MGYLKNDNAIPNMTSDIAPSGVASASSAASAAYHGFTSSTNDWRTVAGQLVGWLRYEFPQKIAIGRYTIVPYAGTGGAIVNPKRWLFEGSNDGVNWTTLDSQINQTTWTNPVDYVIPNKKAYLYYRLNIEENNGHASWVGVRQLMMSEYVFDNKFLIQTENNDTYSILTGDANLNLIPTMTSETSPIGIVSASSFAPSNNAFRVFDKILTGNGWISLSGSILNQWVSYQFVKPTVINKYTLIVTYSLTAAPKDWVFQGSNDGISWDDLDTRTEQTSWILGLKKEYEFSNKNPYLIYRILVNANNGHAYYVSINEIEMMNNNTSLLSIDNGGLENNFIKFGINKGSTVDFEKDISNKIFSISNNSALGVGRVFKKSIDTSKITIERVKIE